MGTKDILLETVAVSRRWSSLPKRAMTDQLTPVDKKVRLPLGMTLVLGLAVSACARIAIDTSTPVPIADNKPKPTDVVPVVDKKLGIQFEKVSVLNKRDLMVKNPSIASQVNALETEIKKRRPELFSATTQVDQIAISVPKLDMTGEEKTFIYPFITVKNTNAAESFVAIVLTSPDGKGVVAQSLTPQDIEINGKKMGALVLEIGSEKFPIFVFPMSIKEWAELSDSQKQSAMIDFVPPKENGVKIPLSGSKLASPALWDVNIGYASPSLTETPTVVPTVTPTLTPTIVPTWTPAPIYPTQTPLPPEVKSTVEVRPSTTPIPKLVDLYAGLTESQKSIAINAGIKDLPAGTELRWISNDQIMVISYNGPIAKYGDAPANSIYNQNNVKCPSISACMSNGKKYRIEYSISPGRDNPKNPYHIGLVWIFEL